MSPVAINLNSVPKWVSGKTFVFSSVKCSSKMAKVETMVHFQKIRGLFL